MKKTIILAVALLLVASAAPAEETKYTNESIARLSHITGKTFIQRASDLGFEEGALNMPISEGDRLGTTEGRAEIHFGRANYIRMDSDTKLDVLNLPKRGDDITRLRVWSGNVFLAVGTLRKEKGIEVHTADSSFYILDKGIYRIDVRENRDTEILVYRGLVEAAGEEGSSLVKSGQKLEVAEGRFLSKPATFMAVADDGFDRWNESRSRETNRQLAQRYLPDELEDFEYELGQYGEWVYLPPYGNVWVPGGIADDWRPYWNGRWVWLPLSGWTWMPYDPWGWSTFHYGRWHWGIDFGWYWIPMNVWGPGWVNWWWGYDYYGWAPMSWWGYPVVIINGRFYGQGYGTYYPPHSRALTVVHKNQLRAPNISQAALKGESLKSLTKMELNSTQLAVRPVGNRITVQPMTGKQVLLRKDAQSGSLEQNSRARSASSGKSIAAPAKTSSSSKDGAKSGSAPAVKNQGSSGKANPPKSTGSSDSKTSTGKIKKKDGETSAGLNATYPSSGGAALSPGISNAGPKSVHGYPSSPSISRAKVYGDGGAARSGSFISRTIRNITGRSSVGTASTRSSGSSSSRVSSRGSSSRGSAGPSRSSGSVSRSGSGSKSGASGSVRKKD